MATCKECIHYDVCYHIEHYGRHMETEESCGGFKNKADFVEVVRCKDCKHGEKSPTFQYYPKLTWCNKCERTHDDNWFCADGERK